MRPRFFLSLRVKLTLFTILLIAAVGAIAMSVTENWMRVSLTSEIKEKGVTIARSIARSSEEALVGEGDELFLFQFTASAMKNRGVAYALIVDGEGVVRAHSEVRKSGGLYSDPPGMLPYERGDGYEISEVGETGLDISVPILLSGGGGAAIGEVHLGLSKGVIDEAAAKVRRLVALVAAAGLVLGGIGAFTLAKYTVAPIKELVRGAGEIGEGNFDQRIETRRGDEIGELTEAFNEMAKGLREKELIKDTFARYMSRQLAKKLLEDPEGIKLELGGEHRQVSVLFTDIRGFTSMAEDLDPKGVVSFLNEYFSMMVDVVFEQSGWIDKFIGDAMMVIYGIPVKAENDAASAVRTGLRMKESMQRFNKGREAKGLQPVHTGIGINSGTVVAGNVGSKERMNYTVVGDTVNVAARLVALSERENVIISRQTYEQVKDLFVIEERGEVMLKGKHDKQRVYEVIGER